MKYNWTDRDVVHKESFPDRHPYLIPVVLVGLVLVVGLVAEVISRVTGIPGDWIIFGMFYGPVAWHAWKFLRGDWK